MLYFVQSGKNGPIKIGKTRNIDQRLSELQTSNPDDLNLIATHNEYEYGKGWTEREVQGMFKRFHIRGEWYKPSNVIIEYALKNHVPVIKKKDQISGRKTLFAADDIKYSDIGAIPIDILPFIVQV